MLWTGLIVAGISMWSFGLSYLYLSLEVSPQPTETVSIALVSFTIGILLFLGGLVVLRSKRHRAPPVAAEFQADTEISETAAAA